MDHADRIRKLRAKADSTTFPAEAEALREKADALAARYGDSEVLEDARYGSWQFSDSDLFEQNLANIRGGYGGFRMSTMTDTHVNTAVDVSIDGAAVINISHNWFRTA